jgi:serine/threonine protein kinase
LDPSQSALFPMSKPKPFAVTMSGATYTGQYSVQKTKAGAHMHKSGLLHPSSGGAFIMNITPRYELVEMEPLGEGSYGSVWLCQERGTSADSPFRPAVAAEDSTGQQLQPAATKQRRRAVVKCVAYMSNCEEYLRMLREVCLMSIIRHPHVSSALDAWTWKPPSPSPQPLQLCIVSAVGGETLANFLLRFSFKNPLPAAAARCIMLQLAAATSYLHAVAVVHRDIKSENILVKELPNGQLNVCLIDFGLAKVIPTDEVADDAPSAGKSSFDSGCSSGENDSDGMSPSAIMRRMRAEDLEKEGFSYDVAPARKLANIEGVMQRPARADSGSRLKRALHTGLVVTSWYRPPELFATTEKYTSYDSKIDVWSLACVFAEIMYRVHPPPTNTASGVLFQVEDSRAGMEKFMLDAMRLLGKPNDDDVEALKRKLSANDADVLTRLVARVGNCRDTVDQHTVFSKMPPQARDLIRQSLRFNPRKRLTAEELYCHPYLGGSRAELDEMSGGDEHIAATLLENKALRLEDEALEVSNMQRLITQACEGVKQRRTTNHN